jgi:hypothetical protein
MKVYVVFWSDGLDYTSVPDKGFTDRKKARAYVQRKKENTDTDWWIEEVEVEE